MLQKMTLTLAVCLHHPNAEIKPQQAQPEIPFNGSQIKYGKCRSPSFEVWSLVLLPRGLVWDKQGVHGPAACLLLPQDVLSQERNPGPGLV